MFSVVTIASLLSVLWATVAYPVANILPLLLHARITLAAKVHPDFQGQQ